MQILRTFENQTKGVFLAKFVNCAIYETPEDYETELSKAMEELQDPLFVRKLISLKGSGWKKGTYKSKSLKELTYLVQEEIDDLLSDINHILEQSQKESLDWLLDNFKTLSDADVLHKPERLKMYTYDYGSLLRLYGIQLGSDSVIITGITIKLTLKMQDGLQTQLELDKLNHLRSWLLKNNISNSDQL